MYILFFVHLYIVKWKKKKRRNKKENDYLTLKAKKNSKIIEKKIFDALKDNDFFNNYNLFNININNYRGIYIPKK